MNINGRQNMTTSEASQIYTLSTHLPLDMTVYVSNKYKADDPKHNNGWYVAFENLNEETYSFERAKELYIISAYEGKQKTSNHGNGKTLGN